MLLALIPQRAGAFFASRSPPRRLHYFGKRSSSFAAAQGPRSTMTQPCSRWRAMCLADLRTMGARAIRSRSLSARHVERGVRMRTVMPSPSAPRSSTWRAVMDSTLGTSTCGRRTMRAAAKIDTVNTTRERAHVDARARAKQDIPPAVRRAVLRRDHHHCRVPGCRNATFLDLHHVVARAEGGDHRADNLLTVCGAHHRSLHRGELSVEGIAGVGIGFRHADGAVYGEIVEPRAADMQVKVFGALRGLGFREGEVRRVLQALNHDGSLLNSTPEACLRMALERLTPPRTWSA
jgi:hypothetical protein